MTLLRPIYKIKRCLFPNKFFLGIATSAVFLFLLLCLGEWVLERLHVQPLYPRWDSQGSPQIFQQLQQFCQFDTLEEAIKAGMLKSVLGNLEPDENIGFTLDKWPIQANHARSFLESHRDVTRVLVLGDSFAEGQSADEGQGFVSLLNSYFIGKHIAFYNTALGGYGQNNELAALRKYSDLVMPQMVLLCLYTGNDFEDNLTPVDRWTGFPYCTVNNYEPIGFADKFEARRRTPEEIFQQYKWFLRCSKITTNRSQSLTEFLREQIFYKTRIGGRIWGLTYQLKLGILRANGYEKRMTRRYLEQMKEFAEARAYHFYVLVIPDLHASGTRLEKSTCYEMALQLMNELSISYLDPFERLTLEDYVGKGNDHLNNSGHFKIYLMIKDFLGKI